VTDAFLDAQAEAAVRQRVAALERASGVETVAAVIARADSYPEIPWKAFALGVSLAALAAAAAALLEPGWEAAGAVVETAVAALATGAAAALATIWVAPFARLFLAQSRRETEVLQYAQAMFLESGLPKTAPRNGILLLVSLFEHRVVLVADPGARDRIGPAGLEPVVSAVTARLSQGTLQDALLDGLAALEAVLTARGFRGQPGGANEVPDTVIQQRGPA
jgi:putative membrane protein